MKYFINGEEATKAYFEELVENEIREYVYNVELIRCSQRNTNLIEVYKLVESKIAEHLVDAHLADAHHDLLARGFVNINDKEFSVEE